MAAPSPRHGNTRGPQLSALVRRQYVFSLRCTGATYEAIFQAAQRRFGTALPRSYNRRNVHKDVMEELTQRREELNETVEIVRVMELQRLDQLQLGVWARAVGTPADLQRGIPAEPADIEAQQQVLRIMQQRIRLLPGLAAPIKVAPTTPDGEKAYDGALVVDDTFCFEVAHLLAEYGQLHANGTGPGFNGTDTASNGRPSSAPAE